MKKPKLNDPTTYKVLLSEKRQKQGDECFKCHREMYFGDSNGILRLSDAPNQASPDRVDNANVFYDLDNFNLACQSCNFTGSSYSRRHVERQIISIVNLTPKLVEKCKKWLQS